MMLTSPEDVRSLVLEKLQPSLEAKGLSPEDIPDNYDLLTEGLIDSMGILQLISEVEKRFGISVDFEDLDPENLTIIGPFCRHIAKKTLAVNR
jgi:acyl carrier protein